MSTPTPSSTAPGTIHRTTRRWVPGPIFHASAAIHVAGIAGVTLQPSVWPWVLGAIAANHAVVAGLGLVPRSRLLGPNLTRLPREAIGRGEIAITFDDGPDPAVTPQILDILDAAGAKASFFVVGERVRRYPDLVREMHRRGHSVENHTSDHSLFFAWYGPRRLERDLAAVQAIVADTCGSRPLYFRAPFGVRSPLLEPALARLGLQLVSWTRRGFDTVARGPASVLARLARRAQAGDILMLHDGVELLGRPNRNVLAVLPGLLEVCARRRLKPVTLRVACDAGVS